MEHIISCVTNLWKTIKTINMYESEYDPRSIKQVMRVNNLSGWKRTLKKSMSFPPSIWCIRNSQWPALHGLISSMDRALRPVIAKVPSQAWLFFQVLFQPLRLFHSTAMIIVFTFKSSRSSTIQNLIYFISQWPQSICIKYFFFQLPLLCLTRHLSLTLGRAYGLRGSNWHLQSRINLWNIRWKN